MIRPLLIAVALAGAAAGPVLAQADIDTATMTCADFLAMDAEAQAGAAEALGAEAEAMGHGMMGEGEEAMMGEDLTAHVTQMCSAEGAADKVATEAMMAAE